MVYIVNRLDARSSNVVSVAYDNKSVWDTKGLAIRYIRCFILEKDGRDALSTAFNLSDENLPFNEPVNRHSFILNEETGCLEVYHLTASMVNGWFGPYRDTVIRDKVFTLSISSVDSNSFNTATFIPFKTDDLNIKNNKSSDDVENDDLSVKTSLMSELKEFIAHTRGQCNDDVSVASSSN